MNIELLQKLIFSFGLDKVYLDVPKEISDQLDLSAAPGRHASVFNMAIVAIVMIFISLLFNNF